MDGPSVNWKFYTDLSRERKTQELPELLKSHGNSLNCHGKVMEKSWNCIIRFLWEPCRAVVES